MDKILFLANFPSPNTTDLYGSGRYDRIEDIAHVMRSALVPDREIAIIKIGAKPGEKMYEELMNDQEVRRTFLYGDIFVTLSAFADENAPDYAHLKGTPRSDRPYNSAVEPAMSRADLAAYFDEKGVLG